MPTRHDVSLEVAKLDSSDLDDLIDLQNREKIQVRVFSDIAATRWSGELAELIRFDPKSGLLTVNVKKRTFYISTHHIAFSVEDVVEEDESEVVEDAVIGLEDQEGIQTIGTVMNKSPKKDAAEILKRKKGKRTSRLQEAE